MSDPSKIYRKIRKLTQYRNKTDQEVMDIAAEMAGKDLSDGYTVVNRFKNKMEKQLAKLLLSMYLKDYIIETVADKNTLKDLVYLEVVQIRLQDKVNEYHEKESQAIPLQLVEAIHKNTTAIQSLKNTLSENKPNSTDEYSVLKLLKKRFRAWMDENQLSREFRCPHCQYMTLLKLRVDRYELQKHPFFRDKRLFNCHLFDNINKEVLIDRDFIAKVLETSPDYIDWMLEKIREKNPQDTEVLENPSTLYGQVDVEQVDAEQIEKGETTSGENQEQTEERIEKEKEAVNNDNVERSS